MSSADEFEDLMPHRVKVIRNAERDDFGYPIPGTEKEYIYMCLVDDTQINRRSASGVELQSGLIAYVNAIPLGEKVPVNIENDETVEIVTPVLYKGNRPTASISRHFDESGLLHNMEIKFS